MKLFLLLSVASLASAGPAAAGSQLTKRSDEQLTKQLTKRDAEPSPDAAPDADPAADPQVSPGQVPVDIKFNKISLPRCCTATSRCLCLPPPATPCPS